MLIASIATKFKNIYLYKDLKQYLIFVLESFFNKRKNYTQYRIHRRGNKNRRNGHRTGNCKIELICHAGNSWKVNHTSLLI